MKNRATTANIYYDQRSRKTDGTYPVKIRVYHKGETRYFSLNINLRPEDFERSYLSVKPRMDFRKLKDQISGLETKAKDIIAALPVFTFEAFDKKMNRLSQDKENAIAHYTEYIESLTKEDRVSTALAYNVALKSLKEFTATTRRDASFLPFADITPEFLREYEKWMLRKGKELTTVGIYLRPLRAVFHTAIRNKDISIDTYPFGKGRYVIPAGQNIKKALDKGELKKLFLAKPQNEPQAKARDYWFFSYMCNGINVADICGLKFKNLQPDKILFVRQKTANTTKAKQKTITIIRTSLINDFIKKYGIQNGKQDDYVFPIYTKEMTTQERHRVRLNMISFINQNVKRLAKAAGVTGNISTYVARHTYATITLNSGAPVAYIQEALGHMDAKTTANYLAGFDDATKEKYAGKLMEF